MSAHPFPAFLPVLAVGLALLAVSPAQAAGNDRMLQFVAGGHALGFSPGAAIIATGSHALRVEFVGGAGEGPVAAATARPETGEPAALGLVTYRELWPGITLTYRGAEGGIVESLWTIAAGADPGRIRLRYNVPAALAPDGGLRLAFDRGCLTESAPVAWQEIAGRRIPVTAAFRPVTDREVGFALGAYDRTKEVFIDPTVTWNTFLGSDRADEGNAVDVLWRQAGGLVNLWLMDPIGAHLGSSLGQVDPSWRIVNR